MAVPDHFWHVFGDAQPAERVAIDSLRASLPDTPTTRAWVNVTFRTADGRPGVGDHELDFGARLALINQFVEIIAYAHSHGVQHRGLTPAAVRVQVRDGVPRVLVRDWQTGRRDETQTQGNTTVYGPRIEAAHNSGLAAAHALLR